MTISEDAFEFGELVKRLREDRVRAANRHADLLMRISVLSLYLIRSPLDDNKRIERAFALIQKMEDQLLDLYDESVQFYALEYARTKKTRDWTMKSLNSLLQIKKAMDELR